MPISAISNCWLTRTVAGRSAPNSETNVHSATADRIAHIPDHASEYHSSIIIEALNHTQIDGNILDKPYLSSCL